MSLEEDILRTTLDGSKSLKNDHYFWLDLAEANLGSDKKNMIQKAILLAVKEDEKNGTKIARNIIAIVTFNDDNPNCTVRPGITILEGVGNSSQNEDEVLTFFKACGAMKDTSEPLEKLMHIGKTKVLPYLEKEAKGVEGALNRLSDSLQKRHEEYEKRPWWKRFLN